jgi:hypothetical protein
VNCTTTTTTTIPPPTTTSTTTLAPLYYQILSCSDSSVGWSIAYPNGTFASNDRVITNTFVTCRIIGNSTSNPGGTLFTLTATGETGCPTTTTTTTLAPTTTTTTTVAPGTGDMYISNNNEQGANVFILNVTVDGVGVTPTGGVSFPISAGASITASYPTPGNSSAAIVVSSNHGADSPVTVSTTAGYLNCQVSSGLVSFSPVDLSTNPSVIVELGQEGSAC